MIAGTCFGCNRIEQIFRKDTAYCNKCGHELVRVVVFNTDTGPVAKIESDPREE